MRHLLFPGGKRLRPAFAFAAAQAVGGDSDSVLPIACAVELIHTYSLVHDDLPCMDDDDLRRGRPTVHKAFGENVAVLAGDALLAEAFRVVAERTPPERGLACVAELAHAASCRELVGGQYDDLHVADRVATNPEAAAHVESIHRRKSAALIRASVTSGARMAGADAATLAQLGRFATSVGVAFQIADDWLDRDSGEACSLVGLLGPDAARERAERLLDEGLAQVEDLGVEGEALRALACYSVRRME